ncbi:MAG: MFS transporter [Ferroplasma sp.]|uniref:MFS transporter n=1 Tax=Ferroplasma sp. TaxID=2591003 RepID=UPI002816831D|nr:MFS transporter [Ferroplasma sp.]WMT52023.1 MAG: MFS transporter [Ferroplasma sp.]
MKDTRKSLVYTSLGHFANDGNFLLFPTLIAYYKVIPHVSIAFLGVMAIIYNLLSGLLGPSIGKLADRIDRDGLLIFAGIFMEAVSAILFGTVFLYRADANYIILVASVVLGAGQAFYHPIGASILAFTYGKKESSTAMGINGSFGSLGRALIPSVLVYSMLFFGDFRGLAIIAIYTFIAAFIIFGGLSFFKRSKYIKVDREKHRRNTVEDKASRAEYAKYSRFLYILTAIVFIRAFFLTGTVTFTPDYFDNVFHSKIIMGDIVTISFLGAVFGQPYFGRVVRRYGGKFTIAVTTVASTVFFGLMLITDNVYLVTVIYLLYAVFAFTSFPVLLGYVAQTIPQKFSTRSNALVWSFGNIVGGAIGIAIITLLLYVHVSLYTSLIIMLVFSVISIIMLPLLPSQNKLEEATVS